jgi:murein DD-endopeptidase MepM/ murein hydrolase activator NlpD
MLEPCGRFCRPLILILMFLFCGLISTGSAAVGFYYTVRKGDTLSGIAKRHGVSSSQLRSSNRLSPATNPGIGTKLWIPSRSLPSTSSPPRPSTSRSSPSATKPYPSAAAAKSAKSPAPSSSSSRPKAATSQSSPQPKPTTAKKPEPEPVELKDIPGGGVVDPPAPASSSSAIKPSRAGFIWPVEGRVTRRFTNRFDEKYTGMDISVPRGSEVRAASDGKVVYSGDTIPGYGRMIIVRHAGNVASCYGHNSQLLVREGQSVRRGQVIARSGDSGRGGEAYLHFEVRKNGEAVNPEPYLP